MHGYRYKTGDRPLEGYTIQRGVGRGAFGEVYYALSDSGREVALKSVLGYEQIELRGVTQCMNLKSPHLVNIFDIRQNEDGQSFVIMEYVAGPSLREVLDEHPSGLGLQKAAFFLREIGKGLMYLHERGIVHRDLKPGNIFYEDGYVKIGDYGLSKAITPSQHSEQTLTVGTVHYMAPEIGQGKYDKSIDIYAMGVLVFEMLTGHVPFFGASHGEILMKHLMESPDVSGLEEPFATVVRKAMAKDPAERYQSVQEMVEAVFGAEHISQSVSVFRPETLSVVAERASRKMVTAGGPGSSGDGLGKGFADQQRSEPGSSDVWARFGQHVETVFDDAVTQLGSARTRVRGRLNEARDGVHSRRETRWERRQQRREAAAAEDGHDPLTRRQRRFLGLATSMAVGAATAFLVQTRTDPPIIFAFVALSVFGGAVGLAWANRSMVPAGQRTRDWGQRLAVAIPGFFGATMPPMLVVSEMRGNEVTGTFATMAATFLLVCWTQVLSRTRRERVVLGSVFWAGALGFGLSMVLGGTAALAMAMMAGISLVAQILSPFNCEGCEARSAGRGEEGRGDAAMGRRGDGGLGSPPPLPSAQRERMGEYIRPVASADAYGNGNVGTPRVMHPGLRALLVVAGIFLAGAGLVATIVAFATNEGPEEFSAILSTGIGLSALGLFAFRQAARRAIVDWWDQFIRPLLIVVFLAGGCASVVTMGAVNLSDDEMVIALVFLILPLMAAIAMLFIRSSPERRAALTAGWQPMMYGEPSPFLRTPALVCTGLGIFGLCGAQRFYVGKIGTGLLWFFTGGFLGIGQLIDFARICTGEFTDKQGRKLKAWQTLDELRGPGRRVEEGRGDAAVGRRGDELREEGGQDARPPKREGDVAMGREGNAGALSQMVAVEPRLVRERRKTVVWMSLLGHLVMVLAILIGVAAVLHLPWAIAMGVCSEDLAREMLQLFDYAGWPAMLIRVGAGVSVVLLVIAGILMMLSRREAGAGHVVRAVLAILGLLGAGALAYQTFDYVDWATAMAAPKAMQRLEVALNRVETEPLMFAAVVALVAGVVLSWPEHRKLVPAQSMGQEVGV